MEEEVFFMPPDGGLYLQKYHHGLQMDPWRLRIYKSATKGYTRPLNIAL
jgi:hypothetical protein